ncbi:molybdate ABC transporter substrate-binding protein [bacterium]|nr:molybdate ABC transporter substrate-binding protein [bacterium]
MPRSHRAGLALLLTFLGLACGRREPERIHFYAAASATDAVSEIATAWEADGGKPPLLPVFASSSTLARQIRDGAPAQLFLSASEQWLDYLVRETERVRSDSRLDLLSNQLVLVVPPGNPAGIQSPADLTKKIDGIAIGDPEQVPAGIYAVAWLKAAGIWHPVKRELHPAKDVRAALAHVEQGKVDAGIVYLTDAKVGNVEVVAQLDGRLAPPIRYPLALIEPADADAELAPAALSFYRYLTSPRAAAIFRKHGFITLTDGR